MASDTFEHHLVGMGGANQSGSALYYMADAHSCAYHIVHYALADSRGAASCFVQRSQRPFDKGFHRSAKAACPASDGKATVGEIASTSFDVG